MAQNNPRWFDVCFMQKILQQIEKDESIKICGITEQPITSVGENYAGELHRVSVEFTRVGGKHRVQEKRFFIAKVVPAIPWYEKLISVGGHFNTESLMMTDTLPKMNHALVKLGMAPLSAQCLYAQLAKPTHLLIEDLSPRGFRTADRLNGLDLEHCILAMRGLAVFHATSVAVEEKLFLTFFERKYPRTVTSYKKGLFYKDHPLWLTSFFNLGTKCLATEIAKWPEINPRISEKMHKLSEVAFKKGCKAARCQKDDFNVLNHGDCWTNNMMFRYDDQGKPNLHIFVDFQLCVYGSPAVDILHFLATSPSNDVRKDHRKLLLHEYHDTLTITMAKFKCEVKPPSFNRLREVLKERAFLEALISFTILPITISDQTTVKPLNELIEPNGEYENPSYQGNRFRKLMTTYLPLYDKMGLLQP
nr:uncharacterized protein LOC124221887 isoform X1 [Neodiprion pinetum]XP_046488250.1 uncharacterized protein LOC124221887 isoform X1 [Neodiprion pinetum]